MADTLTSSPPPSLSPAPLLSSLQDTVQQDGSSVSLSHYTWMNLQPLGPQFQIFKRMDRVG